MQWQGLSADLLAANHESALHRECEIISIESAAFTADEKTELLTLLCSSPAPLISFMHCSYSLPFLGMANIALPVGITGTM
jgi:hypothetical protein